jgi:perosamine synthetase
MKIPLSRPDITRLERKAISDVLRTHQLSLGPKLTEFEEKIADYIKIRYAVAVNSGTSALHLIVRSLGIKEGDEVITTPFSFIASANCILFERAKPVFVDIDPRTLNIDVSRIEEKINKKTRAILAVDIFGHPADWDRLKEIAQKYNLKLIEDSCEAFGAEYKGKKTGVFADAACFAFYPNKQMTTGEGGMIVTNSKKIADLCRSMRNQGRDDTEWLQHGRLGYNYRISDINCALGIAQMQRINEMFAKRQKVAEMYNERLKEIKEMELPCISPDVKLSWFVYTVRLKKNFGKNKRNEIKARLFKKGIECGSYFPPIHLQPFYRKIFGYSKGDFPITEYVSERTLALPFYNNLTKEEIDYVVRNLKEIIRKYNYFKGDLNV